MSNCLFRVTSGGMLTTVQDCGRRGYQAYGVPVSGAVDGWSLRAANILVGNEGGAAGLEISVTGPQLECCRNTAVAVCGGDLSPLLDGSPLPMWQGVPVQRGQVISFWGRRSGCRAYLAVAGGLNVPLLLDSRSTFLRGASGGHCGRALRKGDRLYGERHAAGRPLLRLRPEFRPDFNRRHWDLRVVEGPQSNMFTGGAREAFFACDYSVSLRSDRMGLRLEGQALDLAGGADIVSEAVAFGTVQVPSHGLPIVLLAERQTTGGYAKIAVVITADHSLVAQCMPGDRIRFRRTTVRYAHRLLAEQESIWTGGLEQVK